jgi:hypothetical protein
MILEALGSSGIGQVAYDLLKMNLPQDPDSPRVICNPEFVTQ